MERRPELVGLGDEMEIRILNGERILASEEAEKIRKLFGEWGVSLSEVRGKGGLEDQANRVLEGFGWERESVMVDLVQRCVERIAKLEGGGVVINDDRKNKEQLDGYVSYYIRLCEIKRGEYSFPLNAKLFEKKDVPMVVRQIFGETGLDLQKVGYRTEMVLSLINRLMYYAAPNEEEFEKRIDNPEIRSSLHSLQNKVLRGHERAKRNDEIKVDLSEYGAEDKRLGIRHAPVGTLEIILEEIEKGYKG